MPQSELLIFDLNTAILIVFPILIHGYSTLPSIRPNILDLHFYIHSVRKSCRLYLSKYIQIWSLLTKTTASSLVWANNMSYLGYGIAFSLIVTPIPNPNSEFIFKNSNSDSFKTFISASYSRVQNPPRLTTHFIQRKALHELAPLLSLWPQYSTTLAHSASATLAFLLFHEHARCIPFL